MDQPSLGVLAAFLIFCRIGSAMMVMPGLSSPQIPVRVRLMAAAASTLALAPLLMTSITPILRDKAPIEMLSIIASEVVVGMTIGLMARYFFIALEFFGSAMSTFVGLGGLPGVALQDSEPNSLLGSLISITAMCLIFAMDLHLEMIKALLESYRIVEVKVAFDIQSALRQLVAVATKAFLVAVQLCGPFIIYSIVVNLLFGLANKLMPQLPIYFVSIPFVIAGGFAILISGGPQIVLIFLQSYSEWLSTGTP